MTSRPHDQPTASCPGSSDGSQVIPDLLLPNERRAGRLRGLLGDYGKSVLQQAPGLLRVPGELHGLESLQRQPEECPIVAGDAEGASRERLGEGARLISHVCALRACAVGIRS
jgi:hypothetical protein